MNSKDRLIAELVNKGLDGDMDAVNACEDKMVRAKAKAMILKVNKGAAERPPMPEVVSQPSDITGNQEEPSVEKNKNIYEKTRKIINDNFPESTIGNDAFIQLHPEKWHEIAALLKFDKSLMFDSLQCQMGIDIGDDNLESRYNLHSMEYDHYVEIRIRVPRLNAKIPSVEKIWRIVING